ncbi:hypothetical protein BKA57DRAFT_49860 [Linnemannia elongata]|nr:hypothetical protein BKA57DRAFT_49860 [Linnemannia elongata]
MIFQQSSPFSLSICHSFFFFLCCLLDIFFSLPPSLSFSFTLSLSLSFASSISLLPSFRFFFLSLPFPLSFFLSTLFLSFHSPFFSILPSFDLADILPSHSPHARSPSLLPPNPCPSTISFVPFLANFLKNLFPFFLLLYPPSLLRSHCPRHLLSPLALTHIYTFLPLRNPIASPHPFPPLSIITLPLPIFVLFFAQRSLAETYLHILFVIAVIRNYYFFGRPAKRAIEISLLTVSPTITAVHHCHPSPIQGRTNQRDNDCSKQHERHTPCFIKNIRQRICFSFNHSFSHSSAHSYIHIAITSSPSSKKKYAQHKVHYPLPSLGCTNSSQTRHQQTDLRQQQQRQLTLIRTNNHNHNNNNNNSIKNNNISINPIPPSPFRPLAFRLSPLAHALTRNSDKPRAPFSVTLYSLFFTLYSFLLLLLQKRAHPPNPPTSPYLSSSSISSSSSHFSFFIPFFLLSFFFSLSHSQFILIFSSLFITSSTPFETYNLIRETIHSFGSLLSNLLVS